MIAEFCKPFQKYGVKLICIAGCLGDGYEKAYDIGVDKIYTLVGNDVSIDEAINNAEKIYTLRARELFSNIKNGR